MQSIMSCPRVFSDDHDPCQVSPPSSSATLSPRSARMRLDHGRGAIETADLAVGLGQRLEILRCQCIGGRRAGRDAEAGEKLLAGNVRRKTFRVADAEIGRGLAEIQRHQLAVDIGDMHQRDVSERFERQQFLLGQALLSESPGQAGACAGHRGRCRGDLHEFAARDHAQCSWRPWFSCAPKGSRPAARCHARRHRARAQEIRPTAA